MDEPSARAASRPDEATAIDGRGEGQRVEPGPATSSIGPYRIVAPLGEGGMGTVFLAEQEEPVRRRVAIKLVRSAHLSSIERRLRFEAERRALARLAHPNIAQLYDAGTTAEGNPYFVMELVEGLSITDFCDRRRLPIGERLRLFLAACEGVRHAHQKGVVHRDLKPSNILVTDAGERAIPKVIDFGIAKALDHPLVGSDLTLGWIGTPGYLAPELIAELDGPPDTDTRADVYGLGVVLYELVSGQLPFPPELSRADVLRRARDDEPPGPAERLAALPEPLLAEIAATRRLAPRGLLAEVASDLDWIVRRAIARDREARYPSVAALADDVERHLSHRPVAAGPPGALYRLKKFARRQRAAVAAGALLAFALVGGFAARSLEADRANRAAAEAERARAAAESARAETEKVADFLVGLFSEADPEKHRGATVTALELLDRGATRIQAELDESPLVRARLLQTIAGVYQRLGLLNEARPLARAALELRERELGGDDLLVAQSLRTLAIVETELGDRDAAGELFRRALAIRERQLGPEHPEVGDSLGNLAFFLMQQGRFDEAQPLLERAVAIREKSLGPEHPRVAPTLYNLALLHQTQKRYALAEPLHRRALAIDERAYGADHPAVAQGQYGLGDLYYAMGRYDDAASYLGRALALREVLFGPDNLQTSYIRIALAKVALARGRVEEARAELARARPAFERELPPDHPDWAELRELEARLAG